MLCTCPMRPHGFVQEVWTAEPWLGATLCTFSDTFVAAWPSRLLRDLHDVLCGFGGSRASASRSFAFASCTRLCMPCCAVSEEAVCLGSDEWCVVEFSQSVYTCACLQPVSLWWLTLQRCALHCCQTGLPETLTCHNCSSSQRVIGLDDNSVLDTGSNRSASKIRRISSALALQTPHLSLLR